jgi:Restriction endonuclease
MRHLDRWFVDAKHYGKGVPPTKLQNLLAWAEAENPHTALFVTSSFLSNPARDYLKTYEEPRRPPFEIKVWNRKRLDMLLEGKNDLVEKYMLVGTNLRSEDEVIAAEQSFSTASGMGASR